MTSMNRLAAQPSLSMTRRAFMQATTGVVGGLFVPAPGRSETVPEVRVCPKSTPPARRLLAFRMVNWPRSAGTCGSP